MYLLPVTSIPLVGHLFCKIFIASKDSMSSKSAVRRSCALETASALEAA